MGMLRRSSRMRDRILKLKIAAEKLQRSLLLGRKAACDEFEELGDSSSTYVPADVKEGHFAVIAVDDSYEPKRLLVPIHFLTHPTFLRLLEQAAEEYGFDHDGVLAIPCRPSELERILAEQWQDSGIGFHWGSPACKTVIIKSCSKTTLM